MGNTPSTSAQPDASQADGIQEVLNVWASLKLKDQPNAQPDAVIVTGPDLSSPLEEINRPAAQAVYTPIKENEFRIVTIQPGSDDDPIRCNLSVVEDDHVPEYQALSYVWGSQKDSKTIHLNDTPWQITTNLFAALKQLREADGPHAMWIDALAINQTDIAERNAQVSKMRTMYSLAESTVIWLGPMDDDPKDEVMSSAVNLAMVYSLVAPEAYNEMIADLDEDRPLFTLTMLETLRNCPYWNRVWVVQEIMFSRCIWLVYGTDIAPYPDMESFYNSTSVALEERYRKSQLPPVYLALAVLLHGKAVGIPKCGAAHRQEYLTLNRWMRGVDTKGATEPRDIVFAFAGCFEPKTRDLIEVDYSRGLGEVLVDMTLLLINDATSLDPILMGEGVLEQEPAVPSWLWIPKSIAFRQKDQHKRHRNGFSWSLERTGRPAGVLPFVADYDAKEKTLRVKGKLCFVVRSKATPFIPQDFDPLASSDEVLAKHLKLFSILVQPTLNALKLRPESPQLEELLPEKSNFKLWHTMSTQLALEDPHWESIRDRLAGYRLFCDFLALRSVFICTQSLPVQGESHDRPGKEETIYGFGPMNMAPGDYICAIRGCSLPLILRQVGQYYRIIGSAKVPAIMRGETVKADEDGEEEAEDFFLK